VPPLRQQLIKLGLLLVLVVAVTVVAAVIIPRLRGSSLLATGAQAPHFTLAAGDGTRQAVPTSGPVVVEFFETSCPHCQEEAPRLCSLAGQNPGVRFLGVDAGGDSAGSVDGFRHEHMPGCDAQRYPLLLDPGDTVTHAWQVSAVPTVYLVRGDGSIAYAGAGTDGVDGLGTAIASLLRG